MPYCVLCEQPVARWFPYPLRDQVGQFTRLVGAVGSNLERYGCPACACNDRDRHLWLYMQASGITAGIRGSRILHIAPEEQIERRISALAPREYVRGDLAPRRPEHARINVEQLPFAAGAFDLVLCNHVLEHVADPDLALKELARCLAPGGRLIAQTPYSPRLKWTFEMFGNVSPHFARLFYGQDDHVRLFGADLLARFHAAGLRGEPAPHGAVLPDKDPQEFGCNELEPFFLFGRT